MKIWGDSTGAISFKDDTCPVSKIRGCFDCREDWVEELKAEEIIQVHKVKDVNNLADMLTKLYPTYKFKARMQQVRECGQLMMQLGGRVRELPPPDASSQQKLQEVAQAPRSGGSSKKWRKLQKVAEARSSRKKRERKQFSQSVQK